MRSLALTLVLGSLLAAGLLAPGVAAAAGEPRTVTFIGDSVPAALHYDEKARHLLGRGLDLQLDLKVCRRLVAQGCPYRGRRPAPAVQVVKKRGDRLGGVVLVAVGYNDDPRGFGAGIDRLVRTAVERGAGAVVFATLRESRPGYRAINRQIRAARARHPELIVADWQRHSRGKPRWFSRDGVHLTPVGARAFARFLRPIALRALARADQVQEGVDQPGGEAREGSALAAPELRP